MVSRTGTDRSETPAVRKQNDATILWSGARTSSRASISRLRHPYFDVVNKRGVPPGMRPVFTMVYTIVTIVLCGQFSLPA